MNQSLQIRNALSAEQLPPPSQAWLQNLVGQTAATAGSLPALVATAKARLLASDLTTPGLLDPAASLSAGFPPEAVSSSAASIQEFRLPRDVVVQLLDLENLSQSRWQQVQELEAIERGEQKRGREIIRVPQGGGEESDTGEGAGPAPPPAAGSAAGASATHRLVLQDCKGQTMYGLELTRIYRIGVGRLSIGEKLLLKSGSIVARGVVLLEPTTVKFLGGRVDPLHKTWVDGRLARLKDAVKGQGQ